jgi:hypothetical protein
VSDLPREDREDRADQQLLDRPGEATTPPRPDGDSPTEVPSTPAPARAPLPAATMDGPTGPAQSTELVGDPMADGETGHAEGGAATGAAVGTAVGGPVGAAVGTVAGAVGGAASPPQDTAPGEREEPLADPPAGEGTGPLDPIMRSTMSH